MKATFSVPSMDPKFYEEWAAEFSLRNVRFEQRRDGNLLHVEGTEQAIDTFATDIGWPPIHKEECEGVT